MSDLSALAIDRLLDRNQVRLRLARMSDQQLEQFGRDARYMCSPKANLGKPPRENFVLQLEEAVAEWRRRHPA
jgi:uncharacterized protein YjiS (DUF1127 family)